MFSTGIQMVLSKSFFLIRIVLFSENFSRYLLRVPADWDATTSPRPVVFIHGLGLGLLQYHSLIAQLMNEYTDRPILVPLQPQISQDFFHPHFLKPLSWHQMADRLAKLLSDLGWVEIDLGESGTSKSEHSEEKEVEISLAEIPSPQRGVTMVSHSKYNLFLILKTLTDIDDIQWLIYACLDAEKLP